MRLLPLPTRRPWRISLSKPVRILHTADWHAGRTLMGRDRNLELRSALAELAEAARSREVDLVLVAGDLFDNRNPTAEAEAAVYGFFRELASAGIRSVVIAGNHDSPRRLDAVSGLLEQAGAFVVGEVRTHQQGGVFSTVIRGQPVSVAALPFASERRLLSAARQRELSDAERKPEYRQIMARLIADLTRDFGNSSVNLLMMHGTMEGARLSKSEYEFHSSEHYVLGASMVPGSVQYLALGHIHEAQKVSGLQEFRGRYSGSLIQLDFGETGQDKFAFVVEVAPGRPAETVEAIRIQSGRRLEEHRLSIDRLERTSLELAGSPAWLKLRLQLSEPRPGLRERIMRELPNVLAVVSEVSGADEQPEVTDIVSSDHLDLPGEYRRYSRELRGAEPSERVLSAFRDLHAQTFEDRDQR